MSTQISNMLANTSEVHRWTRKQYDCMVAAGIFYPDVRVELIDGYIVDWIVNLDASCVEVYRQPQGDSYQSEIRLYRGDTVQPLAQPQYSTPVTELLP